MRARWAASYSSDMATESSRRRAAIGDWRAASLLGPTVTETASFEHQKDEIAFPGGAARAGPA